MKHETTKLLIALSAFSLTGCSTLSLKTGNSGASSHMLAPGSSASQISTLPHTDLNALHQLSRDANTKIKAVFPRGKDAKITLWAVDLENLVDGTFTQNFGDKVSPAPAVKLHNIFKDTGVTLVDHLHIPLCTGAKSNSGQYWVLRTYVSDLDETVNRTVKGFYPNGESGDFQAEIDHGNRSMTDTFKLSAKLTECRSGRIIHSAENEFSKTSSGKDNSVYLFGKYLGLFYRSTHYEDPGLNRTKDLALDVFLSSIAMEMVGIPMADVSYSAVNDNK